MYQYIYIYTQGSLHKHLARFIQKKKEESRDPHSREHSSSFSSSSSFFSERKNRWTIHTALKHVSIRENHSSIRSARTNFAGIDTCQLRRKRRKEWEQRKARKGACITATGLFSGPYRASKGPRGSHEDRNGRLYAQTADKTGARDVCM